MALYSLSMFLGDFERGVRCVTSESLVQLSHILAVEPEDRDAVLVDLLVQFAPMFKVPTWLPLPRDCDDVIPFFLGVALVNVRPYSYPPATKDASSEADAEHRVDSV
jgi:hypothetical protein